MERCRNVKLFVTFGPQWRTVKPPASHETWSRLWYECSCHADHKSMRDQTRECAGEVGRAES